MKIPQMIRSEFARLWATPMACLAFVALMCVPLLYGGLYLWANQDPYAKLDQVPVALVVTDEGTRVGDDVRNTGEDVAGTLVEDGSFDWHRVSAKAAARGVEDGAYDFSVTIPEDFTEALQSSTGEDPHRAEVILTTNDANSYLASTIGEQAVKQIQHQIVRSVNREAARTMLDGLAEIRVKLVDARDGAGQLVDGIAAAQDGAHELAAGSARAHEGATELSSGLGTLRGATESLPAQTEQLASGAEQVASGAGQVAAGNAQVAALGDELAGTSQQAYDRLASERQAILDDLVAAGVDQAVVDRIAGRLNGVDGVLAEANAKVQGASAQLDALSAGAQSVSDGASRVATGSRQLADAAPQLSGGIATAADGAAQLDDGLAALASGADTLDTGLDRLESGAGELRDGLAAGVKQLPDSSEQLRADQAANIANPVDVRTSQVTSAGTYGAGLAPFFVSLAAWIGIYALFLILKPVSKRAMTALRTPIRVTIAGWATPAMLGAVQMLALFGIVAGSLGFQVAHPAPAYGMMALASAAFAAIILALNVWLGSVGQFLGLVLMVLQLVTAGGTFPWQTLPQPLAWLHHYLPMSFAVDGLRQLMYGGDLSAAGSDALKLALVLVAAVLAAILGVSRQMRSRTLRDLQPSLIG